MLEITASIFSSEGRAASAAVCARRSLDAATICMALVIFCVALVEAMRTRMSLREAILSQSPLAEHLFLRHARPCAGHPRLLFASELRKRLRVAVDRVLELGFVVLGQIAAL